MLLEADICLLQWRRLCAIRALGEANYGRQQAWWREGSHADASRLASACWPASAKHCNQRRPGLASSETKPMIRLGLPIFVRQFFTHDKG